MAEYNEGVRIYVEIRESILHKENIVLDKLFYEISSRISLERDASFNVHEALRFFWRVAIRQDVCGINAMEFIISPRISRIESCDYSISVSASLGL